MSRFHTRIEIDRKTGEPVELPPIEPLTERERGIVMRCIMDCENIARNSGQRERAEKIRVIRMKLKALRKSPEGAEG